jgi:DNA primase
MKDLASVIELVKGQVLLRDILTARGSITGTLQEEQFSCVFHGVDRKKSSRYYRETDTAYCWVCKEKWDVISFVQRMEQMTFPQAINYLIKENRIDISKLPDAPEAEAQRIKNREIVKVDERKLSMEKMAQAIHAIHNEISFDTYTRFVYSFMMLKYVIPDDKFKETFDKFREAMVRVIKKHAQIKGT